jgi:alpha-galactosidase
VKTIVWFEPERVHSGTWLAEHHPEWILGGKKGGLLNLGNPTAWKWLVEHVDKLITEQGIDLYRQDFNIDPLSFWRTNDATDRQGITEIKHLTGYLAYWDELRRRHPNMLIDSCASGGRRNDLETLRRSVPLLRSDYWNDPVAQQAQTLGIATWIPYYGSGMIASDSYWFRSCIFPAGRIGWDARDPKLDYALLRRMIDESHLVQRSMMGDFHPLTPYSLAQDAWAAWQFDVPARGEGVVQAFRRAECSAPSTRVKLRGLELERRYVLTNADGGAPEERLGRELMEAGLPVTITHKPGAAVVSYRRQ